MDSLRLHLQYNSVNNMLTQLTSWKPWKTWKFSPANLSPFMVIGIHSPWILFVRTTLFGKIIRIKPILEGYDTFKNLVHLPRNHGKSWQKPLEIRKSSGFSTSHKILLKYMWNLKCILNTCEILKHISNNFSNYWSSADL